MSFKNIDLSKEKLKLKLINPFYHKGVRDEKEILIKSCMIERLYGPQLRRYRNAIISAATNGVDTYYSTVKEFLNLCVTAYYDENGEEVTSATISVLNGKLPIQNVMKLTIYANMLTRESSLMTSSYRCADPECGKVSIFDLDPELPIPEDVKKEIDRHYMEDLLEYYEEKVNTTGARGYNHKMHQAVTIENLDEEGNVSGDLSVTSLEINYPALQDYINASKDRKKSYDVEGWVLFDNITQINGLNEAETKRLKNHNGFDKIMKLKQKDYSEILDAIDQYAVDLSNHKFTCLHCGLEQKQPLDKTNFFDFLKT